MDELIKALHNHNHYDGDIIIQIAKGYYELPDTFMGRLKKAYRKFKTRKCQTT